MSERPEEELQFDQADYGNDAEPAAQACAACGEQLESRYFVANDKVLCERCLQQLSTATSGGSAVARFARATALALVAAAVGAGIYFGIAALTGYEIGLVAIVVGFLVGSAVRIGSGGRGGWGYQSLAMVITYAAIVVTYVPLIVQGFDAGMAEGYQLTSEASKVPRVTVTRDQSILLNGESVTAAELGAELSRVSQTIGVAWYHREDMASAPAGPAAAQVAALFDQHGLTWVTFTDADFQEPEGWMDAIRRTTPLQQLMAAVIVFGLAAAAPFLTLPGNIIGLLIIAIAVYEAWRQNKRVQIEIKGPFRIAEPGPEQISGQTSEPPRQ